MSESIDTYMSESIDTYMSEEAQLHLFLCVYVCVFECAGSEFYENIFGCVNAACCYEAPAACFFCV
jgi:hypothetical protein